MESSKNEITNLATTVFDSLLTLKGVPIPIAQVAVGFVKSVNAVRDEFLFKKLEALLTEIKDIPQEERIKWMKQVDKDEKGFLKKVLILIERLDSEEKGNICAKLFKAVMLGKIKPYKYLRLVSIIDKLYMDDIHYLIVNYAPSKYFGIPENRLDVDLRVDAKSALASLTVYGLMRETTSVPITLGDSSTPSTTYALTLLCDELIEYGF